MGAGVFGMNLVSGLEASPVAFYGALGSLGLVGISAFSLLFMKVRRVLRGGIV